MAGLGYSADDFERFRQEDAQRLQQGPQQQQFSQLTSGPRDLLELYRRLSDAGYSDDQIAAAFQSRNLPMPATGIASEFGRGVLRGAHEAGAQVKQFLATNTGLDYFQRRADEEQRAADDPSLRPSVPAIEDIRGIGDVPRYVAGLGGNTLAQTGSIMAAAGLGAAMAPELLGVAGAAATAAAAGGATVGAGLMSAPQQIGDSYQQAREAGVDIAPGSPGWLKYTAVGLGKAALDTVLATRLEAVVGGALEGTVKNRIVNVLREAAVGGALEVPTEVAQEALDILAQDPELSALVGPEGRSRLINTAVGAAVIGGAFGGAAGTVGKLAGHEGERPQEEPAPQPAAAPGAIAPAAPAGSRAETFDTGDLAARDLAAQMGVQPEIPWQQEARRNTEASDRRSGVKAQRDQFGIAPDAAGTAPAGRPTPIQSHLKALIDERQRLVAERAAAVGRKDEDTANAIDAQLVDVSDQITAEAAAGKVDEQAVESATAPAETPDVGAAPSPEPTSADRVKLNIQVGRLSALMEEAQRNGRKKQADEAANAAFDLLTTWRHQFPDSDPTLPKAVMQRLIEYGQKQGQAAPEVTTPAAEPERGTNQEISAPIVPPGTEGEQAAPANETIAPEPFVAPEPTKGSEATAAPIETNETAPVPEVPTPPSQPAAEPAPKPAVAEATPPAAAAGPGRAVTDNERELWTKLARSTARIKSTSGYDTKEHKLRTQIIRGLLKLGVPDEEIRSYVGDKAMEAAGSKPAPAAAPPMEEKPAPAEANSSIEEKPAEAASPPKWKVGDRFRIIDGPDKGKTGRLTKAGELHMRPIWPPHAAVRSQWMLNGKLDGKRDEQTLSDSYLEKIDEAASPEQPAVETPEKASETAEAKPAEAASSPPPAKPAKPKKLSPAEKIRQAMADVGDALVEIVQPAASAAAEEAPSPVEGPVAPETTADATADLQGAAPDDQAGDAGPGAEPVPAPEPERPAGTGDRGPGKRGARGSRSGNRGPEGTVHASGAEPGARPDEAGSSGDGSAEPSVGAGPGSSDRVPKRVEPKAPNYSAPEGAIARTGSWRETASRNIDAIELVKRLEAEGKQATPEEQAQLARYVGFGAGDIRNNLFPTWAIRRDRTTGQPVYDPERLDDAWKPLGRRLNEALSPDELATMLRSTQYAHYTSEPVVRSIWSGLERMGFAGGKILEPGMGIGSFAMLAPREVMDQSRYTGIEYDHLTAAIAKQLLPRETVLRADFVQQKLPDGYFDVAIGNPPFANTIITEDPTYRRNRFSLHDYFFAKSIDKVRPGGLLVFVTSRYTMDKLDDAARAYLAERADLLGAVRLPQTAFKDNAGTEVVTDVLFLRRRQPGDQMPGPNPWGGVEEVTTAEGQKVLVNEYYAAHPEMVLGRHSTAGSMYRSNEYTVLPLSGAIEDAFAKAMKALPEGAMQAASTRPQALADQAIQREMDVGANREGQVYLNKDGALLRVQDGTGVPLASVEKLSAREQGWLKGWIGVRDLVKKAQRAQLDDDPDWQKSLKALNKGYDAWVAEHGNVLAFTTYDKTEENEDGEPVTITRRRYKNDRLFGMDLEGQLAVALEEVAEDGTISKGRFLLDRTLRKPAQPVIETIQDALNVSMDERGRLDLDHIAELTNQTRDEAIKALGSAVYQTPQGEWQTEDEYLSGDVRAKLAEAEVAAANDRAFQRNVEALIQRQPRPLAPNEIGISLGMGWIPPKDIADFSRQVLGEDLSPTYEVAIGKWSLEASRYGRGVGNEWGTDDRSPSEILQAVLNNSQIKITHTDSDGKTWTDAEGTAKANQVAEKMRERFRTWVWTDADRTQRLTDIYNERFNNIAPRRFDGSHLKLPGLSMKYQLHPHQKRAVWRIVQTGNTYLAHAVGAGKTLEMIVSAMEQRRLGLIRKPMFVVPNHMLNQFAAEFMDAYPAARIMVADDNSFHTTKRQRFMATAALNDLDGIVVTHSSFGKLSVRPETGQAVVGEMIAELQAALDSMGKGQENRITRSKIEKQIENIERKFGAAAKGAGKDQGLAFEDMGVDMLYVDEAHEFRKLDFATDRNNVKGINPEGSQRALDLLIKVRHLDAQRPGRSAIFASGTPVTNTMAELYTVQKYLDPEAMRRDGLMAFDAWAQMFGEIATEYEQNAAGTYEPVSRFAKFINVPELMKRARSFMDVLTSSQLGELVQRPDVNNGGPQNLVVQASPAVTAYMKGVLLPRIETSRAWKPSKEQPGNPDPLVAIITDGRLSAIDMRFVDPRAGNDPNSKLNLMIDKIIEVHKAGAKDTFTDPKTGKKDPKAGAAQIVFSSVGFGEMVAQSRGFDVRAFITERLAKAGIKASEVAWMSDYKTDAKKQAMFKEMRDGTKRILIGSPKNMGTGLNVQKRLKALHYLSPPWYPSDVEQPHGRIVRQGNQNKSVDLFWYATKGTYDSTGWAMVARKQRFIEQAFRGDDSVRKIEDISEAGQYEMASALAAGDERVINVAKLGTAIDKLKLLQAAHFQEQQTLKYRVTQSKSDIDFTKSEIAKVREVIDAPGYERIVEPSIQIDGQTITKHGKVGEALIAAAQREADDWTPQHKEDKRDFVMATLAGRYPVHLQIEQKWRNDYNTGNPVLVKFVKMWVGYGKLGAAAFDDQSAKLADFHPPTIASRMVDAINGLPNGLSRIQRHLGELQADLKKMQARIGAPFPEAGDLAEKVAERQRLLEELAKAGVQVAEDALPERDQIEGWENEGGFIPRERKPSITTVGGLAEGQGQAESSQPYTDLSSTFDSSAPFHSEAAKWVVDQGKKLGVEVIAVGRPGEDGAHGLLEAGRNHRKDSVPFGPETVAAMEDPEARLTVYHNHPTSQPLSEPDILALAKPGIEEVVAVVHDPAAFGQSEWRARKTDRLRNASPEAQEAFSRHLADVSLVLRGLLWREIDAGNISQTDAAILHKALVAEYLDSSGLIDADYTSRSLPMRADVAQRVLGKARANYSLKLTRNILDAQLDRPAQPVRGQEGPRRAQGLAQDAGSERPGGGAGVEAGGLREAAATFARPEFIRAPEKGALGKVADALRATVASPQERAEVFGGVERFLQQIEIEGFNALASLRRPDIRANRARAGVSMTPEAQLSMFKMAELSIQQSGRFAAAAQFGPPRYNPRTGVLEIDRRMGGGLQTYVFPKGTFQGAEDYNRWAGYAYAYRAQRLAREDRERLITPEMMRQALNVSAEDKARYDEILGRWRAYNGRVLQMLVDAGNIKADAKDAYEAFMDYIPMYRVVDKTGELMAPNIKAALNNPDAGIRKLKGGTAQLEDPLENISRNVRAAITAASHNIAMTRIHDVLAEIGELDEVGDRESKDGALSYYVNGEKRYFRPHDPAIVLACTAMQPAQLGKALKILNWIGRVFRTGIVATPAFMVRNVIRGAVGTWVQTGKNQSWKYNTITGLRDALKQTEIVQDFQMATGMGGMGAGHEREITGAGLRRTAGADPHSLLNKMKDAWAQWEALGEAAELSDRISVVQNLLEAGASPAEAFYQGLSTINYSRHGQAPFVKMLTMTIPFMNARLQGLGRLFETQATGAERVKALKALALRGALLTIATSALMAWTMGDDDDRERYEQLKPYEKLTYWHLFLGDKVIRIPKPFELGHLFATIPEAVLGALATQTGARDLAPILTQMVWQTFGSDSFFLPQAVVPTIEVATNYDFFRGRPIESQGQERLPPSMRTGPEVSIAMDKLGQALDVSPRMLQHLIDGYGGALSSVILAGVDGIAESLNMMPARPAGIFGSGLPASAASTLGLDSMIRRTDVQSWSRWLDDFYQIKTEASQAAAGIKEALQRQDLAQARSLAEKNRGLLSVRPILNKVDSRLQDLNREIRLIYRNENLSGEKKRKLLDPLMLERNQLGERVVRLVDRVQAAGPRA